MCKAVFGLDVGTTTLSAVAVDALDGQVLCSLNEPNCAAMHANQPYARCQDPARIESTAMDMLSQLTRRYGQPAAIGLDGQMHGILYVNRAGGAVSPLFTWQDKRGDEPDASGETGVKRLRRLTGLPAATGFGAVTHEWHVRGACLPPDAARFCTIQDYLGMRLTGRTTPLTHASDAASIGLYDMDAGRFDARALEKAGLDEAFFPDVTDQSRVLGQTKQGVPVSVALGDNQASFLGAVADPQQSVLINMGTGGQISMMTDARGSLNDCERRPLTNGRFILAGSSLCGGRAYALLESFLRSCAQLAGAQADSLYETMNSLYDPRLNDALEVTTLFCGTRRQPEKRAAIYGLSDTNFDARHLISGVIDGMVRENIGYFREMRAAGAQKPLCMVGSGNAIRKNPALRLAFERAFNMPMRVPAHKEEAACGAALFAMACAGLKADVFQAQKLIRYEARDAV